MANADNMHFIKCAKKIQYNSIIKKVEKNVCNNMLLIHNQNTTNHKASQK